MAQVTVKQDNPITAGQRTVIMNAVNDLSPTAVKNLKKLLDKPKAIQYLNSDIKFMGLNAFL